jgi:hypothetical protein
MTSNLAQPDNLQPLSVLVAGYLAVKRYVPELIAHILAQNMTNCKSSMELSVHLLNIVQCVRKVAVHS